MYPRRPRIALIALALLAAALASACVAPPEPEPPWTGPRLAILGANGRRLGPERPYALPLGAEGQALPLRTRVREALAVRNEGDGPLTLEGLWLVPLAGARPGEWSLLAPTRAEAVPLALDRVTLAPGEQVDLDVGVWLASSGVRRAALTARWSEGADVAVELRATGAGDERLWEQAEPLPGWGLTADPAAALRPIAATFATGNAYVVAERDGGPGGWAMTLVARLTPDDRIAWVTALEGELSPAGICAGEQSVVVVGALAGPAGGRIPTVVALDAAGALRWARTLDSESAADAIMLRCSIAGNRVWSAGVASTGTTPNAARLVVVAAQLGDGTLSESWSGAPGPGFIQVTAVSAAGDGASALIAGGRGGAGMLTRVGRQRHDGWALPGLVMALAPVAGDEVAVAWLAAGGASIGRLRAAGGTGWITTVSELAPRHIVADGGALEVVGDGPTSWLAVRLSADDGAVQHAASLYFDGERPALDAAHTSSAGLRLLGLGGAGAPLLWYAAPVSAVQTTATFPVAPLKGTPGSPASWVPCPGLAARPAAGALTVAAPGGARAFGLTGLRRSGSE